MVANCHVGIDLLYNYTPRGIYIKMSITFQGTVSIRYRGLSDRFH